MSTLANRLSYTCYGFCAEYEAQPSTLGFAGNMLDHLTRCYHLGNGYRAYNPRLMRFHTPDNLSPFLLGGINAYVYCGADPINNSDPSGHWHWRRHSIEPKYSLTKMRSTDGHKLTKEFSGWYHHPEANGWDAEMAVKLPQRAAKKEYYATQLKLAKTSESNIPEAYAKFRLNSVSSKIDKSRARLGQLKRELPMHAREVAESMVGRPPDPPRYTQIGRDAVVPNDLDAAAANYFIRVELSGHDAPPLYRKDDLNPRL